MTDDHPRAPLATRAGESAGALQVPADAVAPEHHPHAPPPGVRLRPHYPRCFGCGDRHPSGLRMAFTVGGDGVSVVGRLRVTVDHEGAPGLAHGGLLATALDETQATLMWLLRRPAVTARLETDFLAPVPVGTDLTVTARCDAVAGRKIYTSAQVTAGGDPVARAVALFVEVPPEHFARFGRAAAVQAGFERGFARSVTQAADEPPEVNP